jgi:ATP-dependent Clp protease ATP-binding subunit ClpX
MSDIYKKKIKIGDAVTIKFSVKHSDEDAPDIDDLTIEELEAYREELEDKIARLDAIEPEDEESDEYDDWADQHEDLEDLLELTKEIKENEEVSFKPPRFPKEDPIRRFLRENTPLCIEKKLNQYVIGQSDLTKAVADFLYYHALRQLHPELPQRPLLISGPSGSGKTEVWRVAEQHYGHLFPIRVVDGSNLSCEGWSGNYKIDTYVDSRMASGGILVVDEFDKLTRPKVSSGGSNVSLDMQAEFLKLMEGEYQITEKRKPTGFTSKKMGFVLVGAFDALRQEKEEPQEKEVSPIGFCAQVQEPSKKARKSSNLTDEDFIAYGIMPEIVGRIAARCATNPLDNRAYMDIIRGPHSRVANLERVLQLYGVEVADVIADAELKALIDASKSNRTGVRWVSAQVETRLLEAIREKGLFQREREEPRRCG